MFKIKFWPGKDTKPAKPGANKGRMRKMHAQRAARRRGRSRWMRPGIVALAWAVCLVGVLAAAWRIHDLGWASQITRIGQMSVDKIVRQAGLTVQEVYVSGRRQVSLKVLAATVGVKRGDNILTFDPAKTREKLLRLGWIKEATVTRRLPNEISITLVERRPLALWQKDKRLALIGHDGEVITRGGLAAFARLPIVVGKGARRHAGQLLTMLAGQPSLYPHIDAAVRIGERRWNLRMKNGVTINLPAEKAASAWAKLADIEARHGVFKRQISAIDLRLPDRLVVRMTAPAANQRRKNGKDT